jgi:hypothetical protein
VGDKVIESTLISLLEDEVVTSNGLSLHAFVVFVVDVFVVVFVVGDALHAPSSHPFVQYSEE